MTAFDTYPLPGFAQPVSSLTHLCGAGVFAGMKPVRDETWFKQVVAVVRTIKAEASK